MPSTSSPAFKSKSMFPSYDHSILDPWCDLGVEYGAGAVEVRDQDVSVMANNKDLHWAFDLGYRAAIWRDTVQ